MSSLLSIDLGEEFTDSILHPRIRELLGSDINEREIHGEIPGNNGAVEAVSLTDDSTHPHTVDGMAQTLLGDRDEKLRTADRAPVIARPSQSERIAQSGTHTIAGLMAKQTSDGCLAAQFLYFVKTKQKRGM